MSNNFFIMVFYPPLQKFTMSRRFWQFFQAWNMYFSCQYSTVDLLSIDHQSNINQVLINSQSSIDRQSMSCQSHVSRVSTESTDTPRWESAATAMNTHPQSVDIPLIGQLSTDCLSRQCELTIGQQSPKLQLSVTGTHTQSAESNWNSAKEKFKRMKGNTNSNFLKEYLKSSHGGANMENLTWRKFQSNFAGL